MSKDSPIRDDLTYLGIAPVRVSPSGDLAFRRADLRFAPEFGAANAPASNDSNHAPFGDKKEITMSRNPFGAGYAPGTDPDRGLSYSPAQEPIGDTWTWETEALSADVAALTNTDGDFYDDDIDNVWSPEGYMTMLAGSPNSRMDAADFGRGPKRDMRRQMRPQQMQQRQAPQQAASSDKKWQKTVLTGSVNATAAAAYTITIRPQFDFVAQDFTMDGSVAATTVTAISFGDHIVFQNAVGVPITTFAVAGFLRGIVKGAKIRGGLDITVQGVTGGAGTPAAQATFVGLKPQTTCD
jgi:hypothetical protein